MDPLFIHIACLPAAAATQDLPWYQAVQNQHFPHFYVADLAQDNLTKAIENANADYMLIDFYAPWCPHCQHFAPEYERLALAVSHWNNKSGDGAKPRILCAEVDCVRSPATCHEFSIDSYPSLLWASREDWLKKIKPETIELEEHTAESAGAWISSKLSIRISPANLSRQEVLRMWWPQKFQDSQTTKLPALTKANVWDAQLATALLLRQTFDQHTFPPANKSGTRQALMDFVTLLATRFPESSETEGTPCRESFASLHQKLAAELGNQDKNSGPIMLADFKDPEDVDVPPMEIDADKLEGYWRLCNLDWANYREGWKGCQGTFPGKRGFTCGLWTSFHMLIARTTDATARHDTEVLRAAISKFFDCEECRRHFLKIELKTSDASDRRSAQLWWWKAHNVVNARVGQLEKEYQDGDPAFPKMTWPSAELCPTCRRTATNFFRGKKQDILDVQHASPDKWNQDQVASFLDRFYGL